MNNSLLKLKQIFRNNVFRGIVYYFRREFLCEKLYVNDYHLTISDVFSIEDSYFKFNEYFIRFPSKKSKLIAIGEDFLSGYVTVYGRKIKIENYTVENFWKNQSKSEIYNKDIRFQWEFYRGRFLYNIGLVFFMTGEEKYAEALKEYIENWVKFSPIERRNVRYNGMEASLKIFNIVWLYWFLKGSKFYTFELKQLIVKIIIKHATYVYKHYDITIYGLESNHGLTCSAGLVIAASLVPEYKKSDVWYKFGMKCLERGLRSQFNKGVNFESSIQYHRYTFELLLYTLSACRGAKKDNLFKLEAGVLNIGSALVSLRHDNRMIPRIGDSDGGRILYDFGSNREFNSLEYLSAFLKGNLEDYFETLPFSGIEEIENLIFIEIYRKVNSYVIYKEHPISLIVVGHNIGTKGKGNHQHNDFLSFELYGKNPFIVDPWSYCYTGNKELRNKDKETKSHNTVIIDQRDIVEFDKNRLFEMLGNVKVDILDVKESNQLFTACLKHNGYNSLEAGSQLHTRKFNINKRNNTVQINDIITGSGNHSAEINFNIPKAYWDLKISGATLIFFNAKEEFIVTWRQLTPTINDGKASDNFLNRYDTYHINIKQEYTDNLTLETLIKYNNLETLK